MESLTCKKGKELIVAQEPVDRMYIVYRGSVDQNWRDNHVTLGPGTVVGLSDALNDTYDATYTVLTDDTVVFPCYYKSMDDFDRVFEEQPVYIFGFSKGAFRQCRDVFSIYDARWQKVEEYYDFCHGIYREYKKVCKKAGADIRTIDMLEEFEPITLEQRILPWEQKYIEALNAVDNKEIENIYGRSVDIVKGVIGISCGFMQRAINCIEIMGYYLEEFTPILLSQDSLDIFSLLYELRIFLAERRMNPEEVTNLIEMLYKYASESGLYDANLLKTRYADYKNHNFHEDTQAYEMAEEEQAAQYEDAFGYICEFAGLSDEKTQEKRMALEAYLALEDKEGKEDSDRRIRRNATDMFYELYQSVFFKSLKVRELPPVIEMFLHFGFMDADALGSELADQLIELLDKLFLSQGEHVFTIYTWLRAIYNGEREPSRNELDLDYRGFVLEERKNGNIPENKVADMMSNQEEKVKFEITNFFKSANRTTSGKMSAFCPVLTSDDFPSEPARMLVTEQKLHECLNAIEQIDFRIFLRETYFSDVEAGINSVAYLHRVEPDVILLPNGGMRAMMWQECGGIKVDTPGRYVFPLFTIDDLNKMMLYCCGSFRWEICRREQGVRWNDISSDCLTSDFYDYFTFYRKNKELTAENKEKIKNLLKSSRNNMREAFTKQYSIWINYEANGSIRLNRYERDILIKYCTFSKKYRESVSSHPMFEKELSQYSVRTSQTIHHLNAVFDKYEKAGGVIPDEVRQGIKYLQM